MTAVLTLSVKELKKTELYLNCVVTNKNKLRKDDLVKLLQREEEGYKNIANVVKEIYPVRQRIVKYLNNVMELRLSNKLHILTISDLYERNYRKVRTQPGMLTFKYDEHGWMWAHPETKLYPIDRLVKIMNNRDSDGLAGTYHDGEVPRGHPVEKFLFHFVHNLHTKAQRPSPPQSPPYWLDRLQSAPESSGKIGDYNAYPFLMFCNQDVPQTKNLVLISRTKIQKYYIWKIVDTTKKDEPRDIGRAVLMPRLPHMMGDQAGVGLFGIKTCVSEIGVYDEDVYPRWDEWDPPVLYPAYPRVAAPCFL